MTFGQRLKMARKDKGFTQKELAATIKVKHNSVSNWEHDQNKPDLDTVKRICSALNVGLGFLLGEEPMSAATANGRAGITPEEAQFLGALRRLDEYDRNDVLEYALFKLTRREPK